MPITTIYKNVYRVGGRDLSFIYDSNVYLLRLNKNDYILVDIGTGKGLMNLISNIFELGVSLHSIRYIILTHAHYHASGSAWWFSKTQALTVAHEPDASFIRIGDPRYTGAEDLKTKFIPAPISINIREDVDEYEISIGENNIVVLHTPGHTKGSISVLVTYKQDDTSILFVGDSLTAILSKRWLSNEVEFKETVTKIQRLVKEENIEILCTSIECFKGNRVREYLKQVSTENPVWV